MASEYKFGGNLFQDILVKMMLNDTEFNKTNIKLFKNDVTYFLSNYVDVDELYDYLDFNITNKSGHIKVKGNNLISSIWLSGIILNDYDPNDEVIIVSNLEYSYNKKTKKLNIKKITN